jgi:hypothetical protein
MTAAGAIKNMYLATIQRRGITRYLIRQSYRQGAVWCSRDLFDLGRSPGRFVHYPGGNAYFIDPVIEDTISEQGIAVDGWQLESLFWRFLDPQIKRKVAFFHGRDKRPAAGDGPSSAAQAVHLFDKRRLHYLRYGHLDQGRIGQLPAKLWSPAANKSRDELEQYFIAQERILAPHEQKAYVFVAFDLQRFFPGDSVKVLPQLAPTAQLDKHFLESLCQLNADVRFWSGAERGDDLHEYLVRYVIMYFDHDFGREPDRFMADLLNRYVNQRRHLRPATETMDTATAAGLLGVSPEELPRTSRRRLARIYRRLARRHHPDQGGDAATFIKITDAYQRLRNRLSGRPRR